MFSAYPRIETSRRVLGKDGSRGELQHNVVLLAAVFHGFHGMKTADDADDHERKHKKTAKTAVKNILGEYFF